jgi:hypothetical protein
VIKIIPALQKITTDQVKKLLSVIRKNLFATLRSLAREPAPPIFFGNYALRRFTPI